MDPGRNGRSDVRQAFAQNGAAIALIGIAVFMIARDQGSPTWVALAGTMLAAFAAVIASQSKFAGS